MLQEVLVIDDSELIHQMYGLMLHKRYNCHLEKAFNGREGLVKLASKNRPDLVLLDINMPVMDGLKFLETMQEDKSLIQIPVIIISTEGKEVDIMQGLRLGATAYIIKPFKEDDLIEIIEKIKNENRL